jgi:hypothetical protein
MILVGLLVAGEFSQVHEEVDGAMEHKAKK